MKTRGLPKNLSNTFSVVVFRLLFVVAEAALASVVLVDYRVAVDLRVFEAAWRLLVSVVVLALEDVDLLAFEFGVDQGSDLLEVQRKKK